MLGARHDLAASSCDDLPAATAGSCGDRSRFGRHGRDPFPVFGLAGGSVATAPRGSEWARSGGAVRSFPRKLVPVLRLSRTEPGSPSY